MLPVKIDNSGQEPIYRQISSQIAALIRAGRLMPGQQLPPERELALQLKVARGTIKKAYEALVQQHYIVAARGRGSLVARNAQSAGVDSPIESAAADRSGQNVSGSAAISRIDLATRLINENIYRLEDLGFSYREIADLFGLLVSRREEEMARFAIATVDCNPESLGIFQSQLSLLTHLTTARILFSDLREVPDPSAMLAPFDLILTTSNHIEELRRLAPAVADKAFPVVVAPSQNTLIALARLDNSYRVGVLYQSQRFFQIIGGWVKKSGFNGGLAGLGYCEGSPDEIEEFIAGKDVLIVPPGFVAQLPSELLQLINRFRQRGGQLLDFAYQIERGSLLHLEELIKNLLNRPGKKL